MSSRARAGCWCGLAARGRGRCRSLSATSEPLLEAAAFAGERLIVGGREPGRRNVTDELCRALSTDSSLPRLAARAAALDLAGAVRSSGSGSARSCRPPGSRCSQRLGDLAAQLPAAERGRAGRAAREERRERASELERLEQIIDASGVARRIEALLPVGVRPRQLSVRTLLVGMLLVAARTAAPRTCADVHQALLALPEARAAAARDHRPLARPARTCSPTARSSTPSRSSSHSSPSDTPDGTPSETSHRDPRPAARSQRHRARRARHAAATRSTGPTTRPGRARHPRARQARHPRPSPADRPTATPAAPATPTPSQRRDSDGDSDRMISDAPTPRRPGGTAAATTPARQTSCSTATTSKPSPTVKDEHGPEVPELARRMHLDQLPPRPARPRSCPSSSACTNDGITIADLLADSGYAYRVPETWALPIRALGAEPDPGPAPQRPRHATAPTTARPAPTATSTAPPPPPPCSQLGPLPRGATAEQTAAHDQQCAELARYKLSPITAPRPRRLPPRDLPRRPRQTPLPTTDPHSMTLPARPPHDPRPARAPARLLHPARRSPSRRP